MNRPLLWVTAAFSGGIAILPISFGLIAFLLTVLLVVLLALRSRDRVVALSGLLTGFGAVWSFLMAGQVGSDGATDNFSLWIAVGVVPLVVGCALIVPIVARTMRSRAVVEGSKAE